MNLFQNPFKMIRNGQKTIELRLNDEKRQLINIGDYIEFTQIGSKEKILTLVMGIYRFNSFAELYKDLPLLKCGYTEDNIATTSPVDMGKYYTVEQQMRYGVLGIEIKLVESG